MTPRKYDGVIDCARKIYRVDGLRGFFRGFGVAALRTLPANGATWVMFTFSMKYLLPP